MKTQSEEIKPRLMTLEYAVREGFISPITSMNEERKLPYIRITSWYAPGEEWMLNNAVNSIVGCDFIVVVDETRQAIFRAVGQVTLSED